MSPRTNLDMFTYIVCVECWNVNNSNLIHMLDFVQGGALASGFERKRTLPKYVITLYDIRGTVHGEKVNIRLGCVSLPPRAEGARMWDHGT